MYRPHEAREDTVLFPALRTILKPKQVEELGERMEEDEKGSGRRRVREKRGSGGGHRETSRHLRFVTVYTKALKEREKRLKSGAFRVKFVQ